MPSSVHSMDEATIDEKIAEVKAVDYDRIGESMYVEMVYVNHSADAKVICRASEKSSRYEGRVLILDCQGC